MSRQADRLVEIAQRLDELADGRDPELLALSDEIGKIAEVWPEQNIDPLRNEWRMPRYLEDIQRVMEEEFRQRQYRSRRGFSAGTHDPDRLYQDQLDAMAMMRYGPTLTDPSKLLGGITTV